MERVMRSVDASLTALYIMTSSNMPKQVYLEDVIDRMIVFSKFQLQNTVYPVFDPAYRVDPKNKGICFSVIICANFSSFATFRLPL